MSRFTFMTINFLLFHTCWMATAYGAGYGWHWLGPVFIVPSLVIHLALIGSWFREVIYLIVAASLGYLMNSLFHSLGFIIYAVPDPEFSLAPYWMFFLWLIFASLFHGSLQWLKGKFVTQAILGFLLGPFAYFSAEALGALTIGGDLIVSVPVLGMVWGILFPFLCWIAFDVEPFANVEHSVVSYNQEASFAE